MGRIAEFISSFASESSEDKERRLKMDMDRQRRQAAGVRQITQAEQLQADQRAVADEFERILIARRVRNVAISGLQRIRPYDLKTIIGGSIFPKTAADGGRRINVDIAKDHSFMAIEDHSLGGSETYYYVHQDKNHSFLNAGDMRLPLTHPLAQNGLERFKEVCDLLGVTSVATP